LHTKPEAPDDGGIADRERAARSRNEVELAPLVRCVRRGMTAPELVRSWMPRVPPQQGSAIAHWLVSRGLLIPQHAGVALVINPAIARSARSAVRAADPTGLLVPKRAGAMAMDRGRA
jgi:hypothetical protein